MRLSTLLFTIIVAVGASPIPSPAPGTSKPNAIATAILTAIEVIKKIPPPPHTNVGDDCGLDLCNGLSD